MRTGNRTRRGSLYFLGAAILVSALAAGLALWLIRMGGLVWLADANRWLAQTFIERLGYGGVFALMFIESSFIPFPSEIIIPPAADLARRLPDWNLATVILVGTAGSLAGALFNYFLAQYLGRPLLLATISRYGGYVRITRAGYDKAEQLFLRHGAVSTFIGRLIPGIRQIISLPAGLARMNLPMFCLLTSLGAGIWVAVLALAGFWFGENAENLTTFLHTYPRWLIAGAVLIATMYAWIYLRRGGKNPGASSEAAERQG